MRGEVKPDYKKKICCKFCVVPEAILQHKWTKKELLRTELSQNFQHFMANLGIFITDLRILLSNLFAKDVYALFNIPSEKNMQSNFIKQPFFTGWLPYSAPANYRVVHNSHFIIYITRSVHRCEEISFSPKDNKILKSPKNQRFPQIHFPPQIKKFLDRRLTEV